MARPYRVNGEIVGFRIDDIRQGSVFEKIGLEKLDVLKSINGEPLNSANKALELYNTLKSTNKVNLEIDRGGRQMSFQYNIE